MNTVQQIPEQERIRRNKRLPSVAFIVTTMTGAFFFLFSVAESIGGFTEDPVETSAAIGGLMQIVTFALPFFIVAWLLWVKPKIGGVMLILLGIGMGIWMRFGWNVGKDVEDLIIPVLLVGLPVILGGFTFVRELFLRNGNVNGNASA